MFQKKTGENRNRFALTRNMTTIFNCTSVATILLSTIVVIFTFKKEFPIRLSPLRPHKEKPTQNFGQTLSGNYPN